MTKAESPQRSNNSWEERWRHSNLRLIKQTVVVALLAGSCLAADDALLRNGFSIRHDHRETLPDGRTTRLYISADNKSFVDVPTENIASIEPAPAEPAPPPPLQAAVVAAPKDLSIAEIVRGASDKHLIDEDLIQSVI